ncbi:MAG: CYTH domain-containing protein [Patescibacteria group bacterium]
MSQQQKNIEIEFRARFNPDKYEELEKFLNDKAEDLGEDDKDVYFFLFPDKLLKVVNNISKRSAKIVLKLNKIGKGSDFEEIEIPIGQENFEKTAKVFSNLNLGDFMHSFQKRHNFLYKGVELALKWSEIWKHHLELEIVINNSIDKNKAEKDILAIAEELGVKIMTDKELKEFTEKAEADYKKTH